MACIEKLAIRGIRAFSPEREEAIEFQTPLTMIVGANGCGKTTLTQRKTTATFKQMDGVIRANDASGERTSYTHKCGELDKAEESSWPLQEGAVLKKKFDDIFESARYSKALGELRKQRLAKNAQVKELVGDLKGLQADKVAASSVVKSSEERLAEKWAAVEELRAARRDGAERAAATTRRARGAGPLFRVPADVHAFSKKVRRLLEGARDRAEKAAKEQASEAAGVGGRTRRDRPDAKAKAETALEACGAALDTLVADAGSSARDRLAKLRDKAEAFRLSAVARLPGRGRVRGLRRRRGPRGRRRRRRARGRRRRGGPGIGRRPARRGDDDALARTQKWVAAPSAKLTAKKYEETSLNSFSGKLLEKMRKVKAGKCPKETRVADADAEAKRAAAAIGDHASGNASRQAMKKAIGDNVNLRSARSCGEGGVRRRGPRGRPVRRRRAAQGLAARRQARARPQPPREPPRRRRPPGRPEASVAKEHAGDLKGARYKGVEEKHRKALINKETTEMAAKDLEHYWGALDKALSNYHSLKIEEINRIVRELWQITYMGEDIDSIEIVSGEDAGSNRAAVLQLPRVQIASQGPGQEKGDSTSLQRKAGAALDMKGRCSAGQRVLASIVIRLALAQTFCIKCGILGARRAGGEPGPRRRRARSLARRLSRIIAERAAQHNFQLVVITHDEEFIGTLRNELAFTQAGVNMPHYWRISREDVHGRRARAKVDMASLNRRVGSSSPVLLCPPST
ncbi:G-quadruplex DNA binding protein [Aureococcus anophagefferens]|uniref:G-quadruplex DNA binding protein n=1 Tax=Aureococcus anophagefferens TaxID=44056 RepID=A0ABR1FNG8_AURAN